MLANFQLWSDFSLVSESDEVDMMLDQLNYTDISRRVSELTINARTDSDFQRAFNQANTELLSELNQRSQKRESSNSNGGDGESAALAKGTKSSGDGQKGR